MRGSPPKCAMIVDRHVHKNGGSTMRDLFLENERLGYGLYQGYTQMYWAQDSHALIEEAERAAANKTAPSHLIMMEAHFGREELSARVMPDLKRIESIYRAAHVHCPLVFVTRVREPLAYYISFYQWGVGYRQKEKPHMFGRNFTQWARQTFDLQSSVLVRGMASVSAEYSGRLPKRNGPDEDTRIDNYLEQFTIVGTTERFDETLLLAADMVGLPFSLYKYNKPPNKGGFRVSKANICPDLEECRAVVKSVAPRDYRMYEKWQPRFEARLQALGAPFAARVSEFKAQVAKAQVVWKTSPRQQTICRYHPETSPAVPELRLDNIRCPVHDSPKLCQRMFAHRLFECPWQYKANSSLTDDLGCWRPSSTFK